MKTPVFYTQAPPYTAPPTTMDTLRRLWRFARKPTPLQPEHKVVETKLPLIFQLAFIEMILQIMLFAVLAFVYDMMGYDYLSTSLVKLFDEKFPFMPLFVTAVLLAPITEEMIFRLPLVYSRTFIGVALVAFLLNYGPIIARTLGIPLVPFAAVFLVLTGLAAWLLMSRKRSAGLYLFWKRHFGWVVYTSSAAFALLHLLNHQDTALPAVLLVLLIIPRFIGGIFFSYTRLRLGLGWAVALHMFINMIALFMLYGYWTGA